MTNPWKIVNFFDIAGTRDLSLIFVLGDGITVAAVGFFVVKKLENSVVFYDIQVSKYRVID